MAEEVRLSFAEHKRTALLQFTNASLRVTVSDFNSDLSLLFLILVSLFMAYVLCYVILGITEHVYKVINLAKKCPETHNRITTIFSNHNAIVRSQLLWKLEKDNKRSH